ncbi:nuclear transport factor 2 family protein [Flavihumibacter sp. RY-1]|uniref:Nuclear transport factor 2 family protein n=1 Tax=Flavihumibacter fluminis TaxID=2909236 RepID=A0ABS9BDW6_9BACT|nr:nuclear transport factor 2 family protein [Flavihumibacter fluminis]MCF1713272.1 nuclear transport factor 2 family protein [Flavihumibacter fluminis]
MRTLSLFLFILLACRISYGQSEKERQQIVTEILTITDKYNKTWETVNMLKVAEFHSDNSFRYYRNMELSVGNNEEFRKIYPQILKGTKSFKLQIANPVVQVLSPDAALIGFTAVAELITHDNKVLDIGTGAYTYVWKKIDGQWKVVHIHESAK